MVWDVVTLGETMIRLSPPDSLRFEQSDLLKMHVGGSESNVAAGLASLGARVLWLSRLTDNVLGRHIGRTLQQYGVDTSQIVWTGEDRVGLYFYESGKGPRSNRLVYDRAGSAMSRIRPDELPEAVFAPDRARLLHLTGITSALGPSVLATQQHALDLARAAGWRVSFDLNYRAKLWDQREARQTCSSLMQQCQILFLPLRDAVSIFGTSDNYELALRQLAAEFAECTIVMTLSADGSAAITPEGQISHRPVYPTEPVERIGGGDAFVAGFLIQYLRDPDNAGLALAWGNAMAALKYTIPGDIALVAEAEVRALVEEDAAGAWR